MDFSRFLPWDSGELEVTNNILIKALKLYGEILSGNLIRYYDYYIGKSIVKDNLTFTNSYSYNSTYVISDSAILTGTWYWEHLIVSSGNIKIGVANSNYPNTDSTWFYCSNGTITNKDTVIAAPTYTDSDIISISLDTSKGFIYFLKNNVLVSELPSFNNLYGSELYSCMELGVASSVTIVFNPLTYSTLYNEGLYDYVTNVEQGLEELQFFWDVYRTKVLQKYKNVLDPDNIVRRIQDIKNSNNQPVGSPSEQAYFLNLPELLKSKGTIKSLQGIFKFFGIGIEVIPWYSPEYTRPQKTGVVIRIVLGGEAVSDSTIYDLITELVQLVLDVCAVVTYISVYKELTTDGFDLSELLDGFVLEADRCLPYDWPNARPDLSYIGYVSAPFKGFFTGRDVCITPNPPDYSGKYSVYCPSTDDCYKQPDRRLYTALSDTTFRVGENCDIVSWGTLKIDFGEVVVPTYGDPYILLVGESKASVPLGDPNNYPAATPIEVIEKYTLPITVGSLVFNYEFNSTISHGSNSISGYNVIGDYNEYVIVKSTTLGMYNEETVVFSELATPFDWYSESFEYLFPYSDTPSLESNTEIIEEIGWVEQITDTHQYSKSDIGLNINLDFNTALILDFDQNLDLDLDLDFTFISDSVEKYEMPIIEEVGWVEEITPTLIKPVSDYSAIYAFWTQRAMNMVYPVIDEFGELLYYRILAQILGESSLPKINAITIGNFIIQNIPIVESGFIPMVGVDELTVGQFIIGSMIIDCNTEIMPDVIDYWGNDSNPPGPNINTFIIGAFVINDKPVIDFVTREIIED